MPNIPVSAAASGCPLETAIAEGARRAFAKRVAALREAAGKLSTTMTDHAGREVPIVAPEARVMNRTADVLDECAEAATPRR